VVPTWVWKRRHRLTAEPTRTWENSHRSHAAPAQCVVAERPASNPAWAGANTPEQIVASRAPRAWARNGARRTRADSGASTGRQPVPCTGRTNATTRCMARKIPYRVFANTGPPRPARGTVTTMHPKILAQDGYTSMPVQDASVRELFPGIRLRPLWKGPGGAHANTLEMDTGTSWPHRDLHHPGPEEVYVLTGTFNDLETVPLLPRSCGGF
jgi:hypothetical protein